MTRVSMISEDEILSSRAATSLHPFSLSILMKITEKLMEYDDVVTDGKAGKFLTFYVIIVIKTKYVMFLDFSCSVS